MTLEARISRSDVARLRADDETHESDLHHGLLNSRYASFTRTVGLTRLPMDGWAITLGVPKSSYFVTIMVQSIFEIVNFPELARLSE